MGTLRAYSKMTWLAMSAMLVPSVTPANQPEPLEFIHITRNEGLPHTASLALAHSQSGVLLLVDQDAVQQYDGVSFRRFEEPSSLLISVAAFNPRTSTMHIGTFSDGLRIYNDQYLKGHRKQRQAEYPLPDTLSVSALAIDNDDALWVGTVNGDLLHLDLFTAQLRKFSMPSEALALDVSSTGHLWIGTGEGVWVLSPDDEELTRVDLGEWVLNDVVTTINEFDGQIWIGTRRGHLIQYDPHTNATQEHIFGNGTVPIHSIEGSSYLEGTVWIATGGDGLWAYHMPSEEWTRYANDPSNPTSLLDNQVRNIHEDTRGVLWVSTHTALSRTVLRKAFPQSQKQVSPNAPVMAVHSPAADTLWLGTVNHGAYLLDRLDGSVTPHFQSAGHPLSVIFDIHQSATRDVWFATTGDALYALDKADNLHTVPLPNAPRLISKALHESPAFPDVLWVSTRGNGLLEVDMRSRTLTASYHDREDALLDLGTSETAEIYEAKWAPGVLWLGSFDSGLIRFDPEARTVDRFSTDTVTGACLPSNNIASIYSPAPDRFWLGTLDAGLVYFDLSTATCRTYTVEDGLPRNDIGGIEPGRDGVLWLMTNSGLVRFDIAHEEFTTFDQKNGLRNSTFYYFAHERTPRGEILLGGEDGFDLFHPDSIALDSDPPPVVLTEIRVDGEPLPPGPRNAPRLRYNRNDLAFDFAALDLRYPEKNRYRVRLAGADTAWQALGNQTSIRYPNLAPGAYTFRVIAANSDGVWNEEGAAFAFRIAPPYWRAWWFWTLIAAGVTLLVYAAYRYRLQQLLRIERLRLRIAHDLHDDVGANLSAIALQTEMLPHLPPDAQARQTARITDLARTTAQTLREIVWIVNTDYDTLPRLVAKIEDTTATLLEGRDLRYSFQSPSTVPALSLGMQFRQNVLFLYKEMLHNAVKHAGAHHLAITVDTTATHLHLRVADDGRGFDPDTVPAGNGLGSMRRRARQLGSHLTLRSSPGEGTAVSVAIPLPHVPERLK